MFLFENDKCPVCGVLFKADDDIVVCPECGTPHHRDCYNKTHICANKKLHGTDFKFSRSAETAEPQEQEVKEEPKQALPFAPAYQNSNSPEQIKQLVNETMPEQEHTEEVTVDGVSVLDASQVIGTNVRYYLPRFIKKKGLNWNWGAFFFGPLYYFFRKMYMQGFMFLALNFASNVAISAIFKEPIAAMSKLITPMMSQGTLTPENVNTIMNSSEWQNYLPVFIIMNAVSLVLAVVMSICANRMYRKRVVTIVKTVDEKLKDGADFVTVNPMFMGQETDLSKENLRKMFLAKQGGVSWAMPMLVYGAMFMLTLL